LHNNVIAWPVWL